MSEVKAFGEGQKTILAVVSVWALFFGVWPLVIFFDNSDLGTVIRWFAVGFLPLVLYGIRIWQRFKIAADPDGPEKLRLWEHKKNKYAVWFADFFSPIWIYFRVIFWLVVILWVLRQITTSEPFNEFWESKKAADCKELAVKLFAYTECEDSPGCTITLEEYEEKIDLGVKIMKDCQN